MTEPAWLAALATLLGVASPIIVAIIGLIATKSLKKQSEMIKAMEKNTEFRAGIRQKESRLSMKMIGAIGELSVSTSKAVKGEKTNGDMDRARSNTEAALREYKEFTEDTINNLVSG